MNMLKKLRLFRLWLSYKFAEIRNVYSHKAVGQHTDENGETIILFTIMGKRDIYRIPIKKLMDDKELLERFHPCQTAKFGAISMGDVLFSLPPDQREQRYKKIKRQMLEEDGHHNDDEKENDHEKDNG